MKNTKTHQSTHKRARTHIRTYTIRQVIKIKNKHEWRRDIQKCVHKHTYTHTHTHIFQHQLSATHSYTLKHSPKPTQTYIHVNIHTQKHGTQSNAQLWSLFSWTQWARIGINNGPSAGGPDARKPFTGPFCPVTISKSWEPCLLRKFRIASRLRPLVSSGSKRKESR
jgi:hypothetical protein